MLTKKKRVSKRNKIAWRKHVNINDVEDFLEDQRLDERLGLSLSTVPNEELFTVDVKPSEPKPLTLREQRKLKALQPLKCFEILQPHSKVPDPIVKRNRVRTKEERKNVLVKNKEALNRSQGILKHRELQSIEDRRLNEIRKEKRPKRGDFTQNIWDDEDKLEIEKDDWINNDAKKNNLIGTGNKRKTVKAPKQVKTSVLPKIEPPHPGMSYNPSFDDHQDLLRIIADKEKVLMKKEQHLNRVTRQMFSRVTEAKRDSDWLEEMSQGLPLTSKTEKDEPTQNAPGDNEYSTLNPPVQNKKKTLQQRRKQKEQAQLELQRKVLKREKKKRSDLHQLKTLHKQIAKKEHKSQILREKREKVKLLKEKEPKQLGPLKYEEPDLEFNMGRDISGNLRNLKKEGSLLSDRFKSMQKRNIIAPTVKRNAKKGKVKIYTKPGHKENDWKSSVARANFT